MEGGEFGGGEISIDQVKDHDLEWKGENSEGEISIDQVNGHDLEWRGENSGGGSIKERNLMNDRRPVSIDTDGEFTA